MINSNHKRFYVSFFTIIFLYMAHTSPLYFATFAVPTILRAEGAALTVIGLLGTLILPWAFKFLWAPWLDQCCGARFGKRKTWIIPTQLGIVFILMFLLFVNPQNQPVFLYFLLISLSLFAATQDIASGAFVIEQIPESHRHWGNYAQVIGTTLGSASGGALILFLYGYLGWNASVICILSLSMVFLIVLWVSPEKKYPILFQRQLPSLLHFWRRASSRHLLYMCLIYRGCEGLVMGMQQPFLVDQHIPVGTIGLTMGVGNMTLGLLVAGIAGYFLNLLGSWKMLLVLGSLRTFVYLGLSAMAFLSIHEPGWLFTIILINMATRLMEMIVLYTIFMRECSSNQAATDFSVLVCGELIVYMLGISMSGYLADYLGYAGLFFLGSLLSIPSIIISIQILRKKIPNNLLPLRK